MEPLVSTCTATLSEGSDAFGYLSPRFVTHVPSLHRKLFDSEEKGKQIMKLSYEITMLKARPKGYSLVEAIQV